MAQSIPVAGEVTVADLDLLDDLWAIGRRSVVSERVSERESGWVGD